MARRRAISLGKAALAAASERVRDGSPCGAEPRRGIETEAARQIENAAKESYDAPVLHVTGDSPVREGVVTGTERGANARAHRNAVSAGAERRRRPRSIFGNGRHRRRARQRERVTGTARGAERDITGTPYYRAQPAAASGDGRPGRLDRRAFLRRVAAAQRAAARRVERAARGRTAHHRLVRGRAAKGHRKSRVSVRAAQPERRTLRRACASPAKAAPADARHRAKRGREHRNVTGTEGAIASDRNPSERAGKPHAFAGARAFKALAEREEPKHLVTGMFGYSSDSAAKVTLSGGAQG